VIIDKTSDNQKRVITAARARLAAGSGQQGVISIQLQDVFTQSRSGDKDRYEYSTAKSMVYNILLRDVSVAFINPGPREMRAVDVWREILKMKKNLAAALREHRREADRALLEVAMDARLLRDSASPPTPAALAEVGRAYDRYLAARQKKVTDRNLQLYQLEFHKKFSIPFSCLVFVLFAFPTGMLARRSGRAVGFGLGLLAAAVYWGMLFTGQTLGIRLQLSPVLAMWLPDLVMLAAGAALLGARVRG
jgi:lipopolysaccharide export system permease protein